MLPRAAPFVHLTIARTSSSTHVPQFDNTPYTVDIMSWVPLDMITRWQVAPTCYKERSAIVDHPFVMSMCRTDPLMKRRVLMNGPQQSPQTRA